jgi:hypothetical protein
MGYYRYMKAKVNNGKFKFPVEIKGEIELPDLDISENFSNSVVKDKIDSKVKEICKIKKKKCRSNNLM